LTHDLKPTQALLIFSLLVRHGECAQSELMPKVKKDDREALLKKKLVNVEKIGRGLHLTLTDAGWAWSANNLLTGLPPAQRALSDLLARLGEYLKRKSETLADFIGSKPVNDRPPEPHPTTKAKKQVPSKKPKPPTAPAVRKRIEAAYLKLTGGRKDETVRLALLRDALSDLDRSIVDAALARILKGDKKVSLMRHDDPHQLEQRDHDAAFAPAGEPFHVIWISS
jgi:hypothetical protein